MVLATAVSLGFAGLVVLADATEDSGPSPIVDLGGVQTHAVSPSESLAALPSATQNAPRHQDPQDDPRSAAGRRAADAFDKHRALQHVPYRQGAVTITLVGAKKGQALLLVRGATLANAHRGWRRFLRRYGDPGSSYHARYAVKEPGRG